MFSYSRKLKEMLHKQHIRIKLIKGRICHCTAPSEIQPWTTEEDLTTKKLHLSELLH